MFFLLNVIAPDGESTCICIEVEADTIEEAITIARQTRPEEEGWSIFYDHE